MVGLVLLRGLVIPAACVETGIRSKAEGICLLEYSGDAALAEFQGEPFCDAFIDCSPYSFLRETINTRSQFQTASSCPLHVIVLIK